jgi:hypothetical protein
MSFQFQQHQSPGLHRSRFGGKRRQAGRNQIRVDEHRTGCLIGQEFPGKGGFTRTVGAGNDDDLALDPLHHSSSA